MSNKSNYLSNKEIRALYPSVSYDADMNDVSGYLPEKDFPGDPWYDFVSSKSAQCRGEIYYMYQFDIHEEIVKLEEKYPEIREKVNEFNKTFLQKKLESNKL